MRTFLLSFLFVISSSPAFAAAALVNHAAAGSSDTLIATTAAVDCTGSNIIVLGTMFDKTATITPSDSSSNSWSLVRGHDSPDATVRLYYVLNPIVSASQTFTVSSSVGNGYPVVAAMCWSSLNGGLDQQNSATTSVNGNSIQGGSVTPVVDNEVVFSLLGLDADETGHGPTINLSFTISDTVQFSSGTHFGLAFGYLIETTATAKNPTWDWTGGTATAGTVVNATFMATSSGGSKKSTLLGVGP